MRPSFFAFASLSALVLSASALSGCSTDADAPASDDSTEASEEALTTAASKLAGDYERKTSPATPADLTPGAFLSLSLHADGTFVATLQGASAVTVGGSAPVYGESGTWSATRSGAATRLRLKPASQAVRVYKAGLRGADLRLARGGVTEVLSKVETPVTCTTDSDCGPGSVCPDAVCLMYCEVNDPDCCGKRTCVPATPPAPPTDPCWGAWLDQSGLCRAPNDGALPASCCGGPTPPPAGEPCGTNTCGAGETCCNPLAGICTKPGFFCTM